MNEERSNIIKVMSYNIHAGIGMDKVSDIKRIGDVISQSGAEIIGLNEVDCATKRSLGIDQAGFIAGKLNFYSIYGRTIEYMGGQYGNAIVSKYPIIYSKNHQLPRTESMGMEPRCMLESQIDINGSIVNVLAAHFSLSAEERAETVEYISRVAKELKGPVILFGDFNLDYINQSEELDPLMEIFKDTAEELGAACSIKTFESGRLRSKIDYILISRNIKTVSTYIIETDVSDHVPLIADLALPDYSLLYRGALPQDSNLA